MQPPRQSHSGGGAPLSHIMYFLIKPMSQKQAVYDNVGGPSSHFTALITFSLFVPRFKFKIGKIQVDYDREKRNREQNSPMN